MMKKPIKRLSVLLCLVMLFSLFLPQGQIFSGIPGFEEAQVLAAAGLDANQASGGTADYEGLQGSGIILGADVPVDQEDPTDLADPVDPADTAEPADQDPANLEDSAELGDPQIPEENLIPPVIKSLAETPPFDGYIVKLAEGATRSLSLMDAARTSFSGSYLVMDTLEEAESIPADLVEYIEPNYIVKQLAYTPNDPYYANQWNLWQIGMRSAFDAGLDGTGVKVGFIDSGIRAQHEDLNQALISGQDFVKDGLTYSSDLTGHGTFAAGMVAAQTNNGKGIAGYASGVQIKAYRVFSGDTTTMDKIVSAINAAIDDKCDILNMSLGANASSATLRQAIEDAYDAGMILIAAVGNDGNDTLLYPAAYASVIGVGSVKDDLTCSSFSQRNASVYVTAPGEGIYSLGVAGNNSYSIGSGTSFAAPVVTGMAALALSYEKSITEDGICYLLKKTSLQNAGYSGYNYTYGYGVVAIDAFINELTSSFNIDYALKGGILPGGAIVSYKAKDETFPLPVPTRAGYDFKGWYETESLTGPKIDQIPKGSLGDRKFYASWEAGGSLGLKSVSIQGCKAVWQDDGSVDGYYLAWLPYSTDLTSLVSGDVNVTTTNPGSSAASAPVDIGQTTWTIQIEYESNTKDYELRLKNFPIYVAAGQQIKTGAASPGSLDGKTPPVAYSSADVRGWFLPGSVVLPVGFSWSAELSSAAGSGMLSVNGSAISYRPVTGDADKTVEVKVYGMIDGIAAPDYVTVSIAVGSLSPSQSVAEGTIKFDKYTKKQLELELHLFGNTVTGVSIGGSVLSAGQYSLSAVSPDGVTRLIIGESFMKDLPVGTYIMNVTFNRGNPCQIALNVTDSKPSGPTGSSPGGGGGGGPSTPAPAQNTVSAGNGSVAVNYSQAAGSATLDLPDNKVTEIVKSVKDGAVAIDLSRVSGVTNTVFPTKALNQFVNAGFGMNIKLPQGTVVFDAAASKSMAAQAAGTNISLTLNAIDRSDLTAAQKAIVKSGDVVFNIAVSSNRQAVQNFDGTITVTVAYNGEPPVAVWYLNNAGTLEKLDCVYNARTKTVTFTTNHLSLYVVGQNTPNTQDTPNTPPTLPGINPFTDVASGAWYYGDVMYAYREGLMNGTAVDRFSPDMTLNRGMIVTILYRHAGEPELTNKDNPFEDVPAGQWYTDPVLWAAANGIVSGYGNGKFGAGDSITRQDLAVILTRYMNFLGKSIPVTLQYIYFADQDDIADYAMSAIQLLNKLGIINGVGVNENGQTIIVPKDNATRAQVAAMLHRFIKILEES